MSTLLPMNERHACMGVRRLQSPQLSFGQHLPVKVGLSLRAQIQWMMPAVNSTFSQD